MSWKYEYFTNFFHQIACKDMIKVNSPNSGCLLNIGNGPQSGPQFYSKAKGREAAHHCLVKPRAAKWPINL